MPLTQHMYIEPDYLPILLLPLGHINKPSSPQFDLIFWVTGPRIDVEQVSPQRDANVLTPVLE